MYKRFAVSAIVLVAAVCLLLPNGRETVAQTEAPDASPPQMRIVSVEVQSSDTTFEPLQQRVDEVSFKDAPLNQCIAWLGEIADANLIVRYQTLEDAGIDRDKPITLAARGLTAAQVLWLILDEAGGPDTRLGFEGFEDNLLIVSTGEDLDRDLLVRIYDVSTLLQACDAHREASDLRHARHLALIRELRGASSSSGSDTIFSSASQSGKYEKNQSRTHVQPPRRTQSEGALLHLLENTISPASWVNNGGVAAVECFNGLLIVRNSRSVHRQLEEFLRTLTDMTARRQ